MVIYHDFEEISEDIVKEIGNRNVCLTKNFLSEKKHEKYSNEEYFTTGLAENIRKGLKIRCTLKAGVIVQKGLE